jgi:putative heme iron utilization protein
MATRRSTRAEETRALLRAQKAGVISTVSAKLGGTPFGSLASYALDARGQPVFLFSALAQHTQNLAADPRASLFVWDTSASPQGSDDPQQAKRACLAGKVSALDGADAEAARTAFLARHPQAEPWLQLDFRFYRLAVEEVQFVGGFAQASWIQAEEILD